MNLSSVKYDYKCKICNKEFITKETMIIHNHNKHQGSKHFLCIDKKCPYVTKKIDCLQRHILKFHSHLSLHGC